jgi:hypothetical protein
MNFTAADLLFSTFAFLLFAIFLIPPGYALGWALDLVSFRKQTPAVKFLLSLPLSIALLPILVYLLGLYSFGWPIWTIYGALFALFIAVSNWRGLRISRLVWIASALWVAISFNSLIDWQWGKELYYSVTAYDYNFRSSVTGAFVRAHSLPPANPFFSDGQPQLFRYHYFWFMLCALPVRLAEALFGPSGLAPRHAVIASSAWVGLALFAVAALYLRFFFDLETTLRRRVTLIAVLLFSVSGLDIIPALLGSFDGFFPTVDWWNSDQVTGWADSMLWVPHSLASLVACLTGFLILWNRPKFRWQDALAAGLAFASAVGLSIYVTLVFASFAAIWTGQLAWKRNWPQVANWAASGLCAALLALPFLRELAGKPGTQGSFLVLEFRHFQPVAQLLDYFDISSDYAFGVAYFLCLPLGYFLELGFFFLAGWFGLRQRRAASPADSAACTMLVATVLFCSVVRSHTIQMNDLGARGMLIAQFVLLLWGAFWLAQPGKWHWLVQTTLALGLITTVYELAMMRAYPILADHDIITGCMELTPDPNLGLRDFDARRVYETLGRILPTNAIVQHNPSGAQDIMAGLYANRQFAIMDLATAVTFTGDPKAPTRVRETLRQLFAGERNDPQTVCRDLSIDALVIKDVDPAWNNPSGWVWHTPQLAGSDMVVAIDCRSAAPVAPPTKH